MAIHGGSINRFEILQAIVDNEVCEVEGSKYQDVVCVDELRRKRASANGVTDLMENLKPKKQSLQDKAKNKSTKASLATDGNLMVKLFRKLKRLKPILKSFNRKFLSILPQRVKQKRNPLVEIQGQLLSGNVSDDNLLQEKAIFEELLALKHDEESFLRQKSEYNGLRKVISILSFFIVW
ncbi:hypothetical protein PTKIN_Ptkin03bG0158600 [Pterospermum kingtungense]